MGKDERHFDSTKLNLAFAISSFILLAALIALFMKDYMRDWKKHQAKFRTLEIEKTRTKFDKATNELNNNDEYKKLSSQLLMAKKEYAKDCNVSDEMKEEIAALETQEAILKQKYSITKAKLDVAKFQYEKSHENKGDNSALKAIYTTHKNDVTSLKTQLDDVKNDLKSKWDPMTDCGDKLKKLEREERKISKKQQLLEIKLSKIDPDKRSLTNQFADIVRDLPIIDLANPRNKIEQIVLKDITDDTHFASVPKVERCITCHQGIVRQDFSNAEQPYTAHPNLKLFLSNKSQHPIDAFGCTVCHGGRGRGTDFSSAAHTPATKQQADEWKEKYNWKHMEHWEEPMLPLEYTQASCFKCHNTQPSIKGADKLNLGLQLIETAGCYSCHTIKKYQDWDKSGPSLTHIASKLNKDWAHKWIADPTSFRVQTWMPSFYHQSNTDDALSVKRSNEEIHAMIEFLFSKSKSLTQNEPSAPGNAVKGEELVRSIGCIACHQLDSNSTEITTKDSLRQQVGPTLSGLGTKTHAKWLYNWLKNPTVYHQDTLMPNMRLSDEEAADITAYLLADKNPNFQDAPVQKQDDAQLTEIIRDLLSGAMSSKMIDNKIQKMSKEEKLNFAGEKLINHYGCYTCHNIEGFENVNPIGTELTKEGDKPVHNLDFGFIHLDHSRQAWFKQKLLEPRIFDQGKIKTPLEKLKMPNYNFTEQEADAIVTALLGFVDDSSVQKMKVKQTVRNASIFKGQEVIRQMNCKSCHIIEGEGGSINESVADWLVRYREYGAEEAKALSTNFSPPNLIGEGEKVQPNWLFEFFHQPSTIRPWLQVRMPTYQMKTDEINTLIKYFNALDDEPFPFTAKPDMRQSDEEREQAQKLYSVDYFNCTQCHIVGTTMPKGSVENWAPDLGLAPARLKPDWLIKWLKNPQEALPGTKMPTYFDPDSFDMSGPDDLFDGDENRQIEALRNYIMNLSPHHDTKQKPTKKLDQKVKIPADKDADQLTIEEQQL